MPSAGYIATTKFPTTTTGTGPFTGPNVVYINSDTDIEVEKIAAGAEPNAGIILNKVDGTPGETEYNLDSSEIIPKVTLGVALATGDVLKIRRKTTRGLREVDFVQGSTLTEADLDKATKQGIYLGEEALDRAKDAKDLYDVMSGGYESTELPTPGVANKTLVSDGAEWVPTVPADTRTALGLGTAAEEDTGTAVGEVPVNVSPGGALGTAAYVDTGTATDEVPLNTTAGPLENSAYIATGTTTGTIPVLIATDALPAVSGVNLTNLNQPQRITIQHAYLADDDSDQDSATSTQYLSGTLDKLTWHTRPLNTTIVHEINDTANDLGITLTGPANIALPAGGVGAEIVFTEAGTYEVQIHSHFMKANDFVTRLVDLNDAGESTRVVIQGTTAHSKNDESVAVSMGTGVFTLGGGARPLVAALSPGVVTDDCRRFSLQYAMTQDSPLSTASNRHLLGPSIYEQITDGTSTDYITNVFAWVDIKKLS